MMPWWFLIFLTVISVLLLATSMVCAQCNISVTTIAFGTYDVFALAPLDSTGQITVGCTQNIHTATITISKSTTSGTFNPRQMKLTTGSDILNYNIFTTSARTTIWGDGTGGTSSVQANRPPGKPNPWSTILTMYARIPSGQNVSVGSYSDTLTVTVTP